jgi:anti-sigma regulatory factor (Ser/Thr protein kinase)
MTTPAMSTESPGGSPRFDRRRRFPLRGSAVSAARHFVSDQVRDPELSETVALLVSELATNALVHGATTFEVHAVVDAHVRVEVTDDGPGWPRVVHARPDAGGGRGLLIVDELASRWGAERLEHGKRVWFEV